MKSPTLKIVRSGLLAALFLSGAAQAALFSDDEARKAILELRQRVDAMRVELLDVTERNAKAGKDFVFEETASMGRSLLELQRQIELLRGDVAGLRGTNEELARQLADLQRRQKDDTLSLIHI